MRSLVGYSRTGRIQKGPGSDLVEMQGPDGARHTAIEFHPEYRSHNAINAALGVVLSFLESPMVSGLADLGAYDLQGSLFVYPTGQTWSVAEVVRTLSDLGEVGGVRAGVELMAQAGQVLVEAAETGELAGVYSHGGLTPWRVMLDAEGRLQIIGHALPQVEILTFHEQPDRIPREDAFRYCPPERMESKRENFSSDLFGLGLIAFEVMCGKPVYDGLVNDIRAKAARGETSRRIHQFREFLPESVRSLLTTTLRPDFRDRFHAGSDFFQAVNDALADKAVTGVGLREMMQRVIRQQPRARQELDPGKTSMLSKDELRKMMDDEDEPAAPKPQRAAFAPPSRGPAATPAATPAPPPRAAAPPPPVSTPAPAAEPAPSAASAAALGASSSRVGLPPARRPPPRTGPESLGEAAPAAAPTSAAAPMSAPPAQAAAPVQAPPVQAAAAPSLAPEADGPRYGPPLRTGARPNPRASGIAAAPPAEQAPPAFQSPAPPAFQGAAPPANLPPPRAAADPEPAEPPRPAVGVARLPPNRRPPPGAGGAEPGTSGDSVRAEPMAPPPPAGRAVPPPPAVNSGDRAKDLLARVRASGSGTSDAFARPTPSASSVLDRILTSSGNGQALRDRVARAVQESSAGDAREAAARAPEAPPAPPAAAPGRDAAPRVMDGAPVRAPEARPPEARAPLAGPPPAPPAAPAAVSPATPGNAPAPRPPAPPTAGTPPTASTPPTAGTPPTASTPPAGATGPAAATNPAAVGGSVPSASTTAGNGLPLTTGPGATPPATGGAPWLADGPPATGRPAPAPGSPTPTHPAGTPGQLAQAAIGVRARVPDALKNTLRGEPLPYKIARGPAVAPQRRRIPAQSTLADVVGLLVGQVVPLRTTLDGRVAGWWRLGPASGPLPAETRLDAVDAETTLVFHFVESRVATVELEVHASDVPLRLRAPLATAVPVQTLLDAVANLLDLPAADWVLVVDGAPLEPFHILEDRAASLGGPVPPTLTVRRA